MKQTLKKRLFYTLLIGLFAISANEKTDNFPNNSSELVKLEQHWVDSVFQVMTPDERIGQLMMIRAHSDLGADHIAAVERLLKISSRWFVLFSRYS